MTANVAIYNNKKAGEFCLIFTANGYALPVGNSTTSNVNGSTTCVAIGEEVIQSATIREVIYGFSNTSMFWTLARGANTYFNFGNNDGTINFAADGIAFTPDATANVVATINGTGSGFLIVKMKKQGTSNSGSYGT